VIAALLLLEAKAIKDKQPRNTISEVTWRVVLRMPFVAFLLGYLMGHLTWPPAQCSELLLRSMQ
jgi:hypothetical protein